MNRISIGHYANADCGDRISLGEQSASQHVRLSNFRWRAALTVLVAVVIASLVPYGRTIEHVLLIAWAFTGTRRAIQSLFISWLLLSLNRGLGVDDSALVVSGETILLFFLRWLLIAVALSYPLLARRGEVGARRRRLMLLTSIGILLVVANMFASEFPSLSVLKLSQFLIWLIAIISLFQSQSQNAGYWKSWITTFFVTILLMSAPLMFLDIGYFVNGSGFQGVLNQPQAMGVLAAPLAAWFCTRFMFSRERTWPVLCGAALGAAFVFLSFSRNAVLAFFLSMAATLVIASGTLTNAIPSRQGMAKFLAVCVLMGMLVVVPLVAIVLAPEILEFLTKGAGGSLSESFEGSRGLLIYASWQNFLQSPFFGIGFGVPSNLAFMEIFRDPVFGLPISAPVEKGVLIMGMLEENGIVGSIFLIGLCYFIIRPAMRTSQPHTIGLVLGCLFVNIGEALLFSMGGMGFILWMLIAYAQLDAERIGV